MGWRFFRPAPVTAVFFVFAKIGLIFDLDICSTISQYLWRFSDGKNICSTARASWQLLLVVHGSRVFVKLARAVRMSAAFSASAAGKMLFRASIHEIATSKVDRFALSVVVNFIFFDSARH